jgi:hypothetical protein
LEQEECKTMTKKKPSIIKRIDNAIVRISSKVDNYFGIGDKKTKK